MLTAFCKNIYIRATSARSALPAAGYAELPTPLSGLASGPKTVLFVRHGQSTANAATDKKRPQDPLFLDAPLTERGRTQASRSV